MKTVASILAGGAILALSAQAGIAANAKQSTAKVGYGPYAYLGSTARAKHSTVRIVRIGYGDVASVRVRQP